MSTKLIAAELATVAGITTVIINSLCPQDILPIIEASEDVPDDNDRTEEQVAQGGYGLPKCTRFIRQPTRLNECVVLRSVFTLADLLTLFQSKMVGSTWPALRGFSRVSS
jgi:glutamate 5-kinase